MPIKLARRRFLALAISAASAVCFLTFAVTNSPAQNAATSSNSPQDDVVLTRLAAPSYPKLARVARVQGDMELKLGIRQDGAIASAEVVSGPALLELRQAALDSALHSQFECKNCSRPITTFRMVYTFQFVYVPLNCEASGGGNSATIPPQFTRVTHLENHVTVITNSADYCDDPSAPIRLRSAKCLWLWHCGHH